MGEFFQWEGTHYFVGKKIYTSKYIYYIVYIMFFSTCKWLVLVSTKKMYVEKEKENKTCEDKSYTYGHEQNKKKT